MMNNFTPKEQSFIELENACSESFRRFLIEQYRELFGLDDSSSDMPADEEPAGAPVILLGGDNDEYSSQPGIQPGYCQILRKLYLNTGIGNIIRQSERIAAEVEEQLMNLVVDTEDEIANQPDPYKKEKELLDEMQSMVDDSEEFNRMKNSEEVREYLEKRLSESDREFFNQCEDTKATRQLMLGCWKKALENEEQKHKNEYIDEKGEDWLEELKRKITKIAKAMKCIKRLPVISDIIWYGMEKGNWSMADLTFLKLCDDIIEHNNDIKEIAELIGRMASAEEKLIEEHFSDKRLTPITTTSHALKSEMVGVHLSDDVSALLPSEVALLTNPHSESLFYKRYVEKKLQTFDFIHKEKEWLETDEDSTRIVRVRDDDKGPVIICLDTSGSMMGKPEILAKAMCLALLQIALRDCRPCFLITFSTEIETLELTNTENISELFNFISHSFHGGTDINQAIIAAMDELYVERYRRADVLAISDFIAPCLPADTLERIQLAKENKTRFHALATETQSENNGRLFNMDMFDNIWQCDMESDLTSAANLANCIHTIKITSE